MIKLEFADKPAELTPQEEARLTKEFINSGLKKEVWKKKYIKVALMKMSHGKCCFTEIALGEEGKHMEVEHFHPKSAYPKEVVKWENLLPSSSVCNSRKGALDTKTYPIVHPVYDNPKEHIAFEAYRFYGKTEKGKRTIEELDLNNRKQLCTPRAKVGFEALEKLEEHCVVAQEGNIWDNTKQSRALVRKVKNLFREATPEAEYSATVATVILIDENFQKLKELLSTNGAWDEELENLEKQMRFCALPERE